MRKVALGTVLVAFFLLALNGCGWFLVRPPGGLPEEILPGWGKEVEASFYSDAVPEGGSGTLGAVWQRGEGWIWAEVISFPDPETAHARFVEEVSSLSDSSESDLGDEGVSLSHPQSGLSLEMFRVGSELVLVGSLATTPQDAPSASDVHLAAEGLIDHLPQVPPAVPAPATEGACTPPEGSPYLKVIEVPLRLPDGEPDGVVTLLIKIVPTGDGGGGLCQYRFEVYVKCIELGSEDGDPGLRGPGDLFLAGSVALPCGTLNFLTPELAQLEAGSSVEFPDDGVLIGLQDCLTTCGMTDFPVVVNLVLRNHNRVDLLDLLCGFFWGFQQAEPMAQPQWETAENLSKAYGPEGGEPDDPLAAAEGVRGSLLGEGEQEVRIDLPGGYFTFGMDVATPGECHRISDEEVRCRVPAGSEGRAVLTTRIEPPVHPVRIEAVSLPTWAEFHPVTGYGVVTTACTFVPPLGAVGTTAELRFRAMTLALGLSLELTLYIEVLPPDPESESPE